MIISMKDGWRFSSVSWLIHSCSLCILGRYYNMIPIYRSIETRSFIQLFLGNDAPRWWLWGWFISLTFRVSLVGTKRLLELVAFLWWMAQTTRDENPTHPRLAFSHSFNVYTACRQTKIIVTLVVGCALLDYFLAMFACNHRQNPPRNPQGIAVNANWNACFETIVCNAEWNNPPPVDAMSIELYTPRQLVFGDQGPRMAGTILFSEVNASLFFFPHKRLYQTTNCFRNLQTFCEVFCREKAKVCLVRGASLFVVYQTMTALGESSKVVFVVSTRPQTQWLFVAIHLLGRKNEVQTWPNHTNLIPFLSTSLFPKLLTGWIEEVEQGASRWWYNAFVWVHYMTL